MSQQQETKEDKKTGSQSSSQDAGKVREETEEQKNARIARQLNVQQLEDIKRLLQKPKLGRKKPSKQVKEKSTDGSNVNLHRKAHESYIRDLNLLTTPFTVSDQF